MDEDPLIKEIGFPTESKPIRIETSNDIFTMDQINTVGFVMNKLYAFQPGNAKPSNAEQSFGRNAFTLMKSAAYAHSIDDNENPHALVHSAHSLREVFHCWDNSDIFCQKFDKAFKLKLTDLEKKAIRELWKVVEYFHGIAHINNTAAFKGYRKRFDAENMQEGDMPTRTVFDKLLREFFKCFSELETITKL